MDMNQFLKITLGIALSVILTQQQVQAQYEARVWNNFGISAPLTKKLSARVSYLKSFSFTDHAFETSFNWYAFRLNYDYNRDWDFSIGSAWMNLPTANRTTFRVMAEGTHRIKLDRRFVLRNSLQLESHNEQENRFDYRFIYSARIGLRKRLDFLNVAPSLTYGLFFNVGGDPLRYFNEQGEQIARKSSNGFHRGRLMANFNFKISDPIRLSVFYTNQHEFNLGVSKTNEINVLNPNTGRIQRRFNNQHIIGFSLSFQLKGIVRDQVLPINF